MAILDIDTSPEAASEHTRKYYREIYEESLERGVSPQVITDERVKKFMKSKFKKF